MGGKAKFKKHTAAELSKKLEAQRNKGGGKDGSVARTTVKLGFTCEICKSSSPDIKSFEQHYASKHPKAAFNRDEVLAKAEAFKQANSTHVAGSHHNGGRGTK